MAPPHAIEADIQWSARELRSPVDAEFYAHQGLSAFLHLGLLAALALLMPRPMFDDAEGTSAEDVALIQRLLVASGDGTGDGDGASEKQDAVTDAPHGDGRVANGEEPSTGRSDAVAAAARYAVRGSIDNPDPHIARKAALESATSFGMLALLQTGDVSPGGNAPTAPWGREDAAGNDPASARGSMWGDAIGDSFGAAGVALSGTGEGGGGRGEGISIGGVGTIGHGAGTTGGQGACGCGEGRMGGSHVTHAPTLRCGGSDWQPGQDGCAATVNGRLPPEVVQRVVRQNFGRFRVCYEAGLREQPSLEGRISVKFVIGRDGSVEVASDAGSDLPSDAVASCVVRAFSGLSFPRPEGGIVTVVYPIVFSTGV